MNIAYVTPEFMTSDEKGGLATYIDNISKMLADRGHKIVVITLGSKTERIDYYENITVYTCDVKTDELNTNIPGIIYRIQAKELNNKLKKTIEQGEKIEIVQYPNWRAIGLDRLEIPTVVRISSDLPLWRASNRYDFDINAKYDCIKVTDYLEDIALMRADGVFCPSKLIADIIGKRCGLDISIIESPFRSLSNLDYTPKICGSYFFTFGTLKHMKGVRVIGESIYEILSRNPKLLYVFAGTNGKIEDCNGDTIDAISYFKKKAGMYADRIKYLGVLDRKTICKIARDAVACVLPSRIDNLPNTCIEAMASGGIVIGTRNASFEQLIHNGINGYLIERDNKDELIMAIEMALRLDDNERESMQENAISRVLGMTSNQISEQMITYYREIIQKKSIFHYNDHYKEMINKYNNEIYQFDGGLILR